MASFRNKNIGLEREFTGLRRHWAHERGPGWTPALHDIPGTTKNHLAEHKTRSSPEALLGMACKSEPRRKS